MGEEEKATRIQGVYCEDCEVFIPDLTTEDLFAGGCENCNSYNIHNAVVVLENDVKYSLVS